MFDYVGARHLVLGLQNKEKQEKQRRKIHEGVARPKPN